MKFSQYFNIDPKVVEDYGAIDISFVCDLPYFIDPMLIFQSKKTQYIKLHNDIIKYFCFLAEKSKNGFSKDEIEKFFNFSEIKNNWFGFCLNGNEGSGLGKDFANFLSNNISNITNNNNVTRGIHIEKSLLFYSGNGKDKISDLTTNLIFKYLINYTEIFAKQYLLKEQISTFECFAEFDYETEAFKGEIFELPFVLKNEKKEFVILTPADLLRKDEPSINRRDFESMTQEVRFSINNSILRSNIEGYISKRVKEYLDSLNKKKACESVIERIEKNAFLKLAEEFPVLYDYYICIKEGKEVTSIAEKECQEIFEKFVVNSDKFIEIFSREFGNSTKKINTNSKDELIQRLKYFKHIIEDCDAYKCLYHNGNRISTEDDLNRMFRFVWYGTLYDVNYDANNGRGEYDVAVSYGAKNKCLAEFKLANNSKLKNVFKQAEIYEKANCTKGSVYAIFYFSLDEYNLVFNILKDQEKEKYIGESIILIDCRPDNKTSASKV